MAIISVSGAVGGIGLAVAGGYGSNLWIEWMLHNGLLAVGASVIVWLTVAQQPRNAAIWAFAWAGALTGAYCAAAGVLVTFNGPGSILEVVPAELPTWLGLVATMVNWSWLGIFVPMTLGLLLFPDGRLPSPRWRWLFWLIIAVLVVVAGGLIWEARPSGTLTLGQTQDTEGGFRTVTSSMVTVGYPTLGVLALLSVGSLIARFRRSSDEVRSQIKWVVWGAMVTVFLLGTALLVDEVAGRLDLALWAAGLSIVVLVGSFGIAIARHRLFDVDVVISKSIVYAGLGLFITGVYVAVVVGLGQLFGVGGSNRWLGILATTIVALAFQPIRRSLTRYVDRVVFGRSVSAYQVLSFFSQGVSAADPQILDQIARSLVEGTTAVASGIWIRRGDGYRLAASWPGDSRLPEIGDPELEAVPVTHDGERLGAVGLANSRDNPLTPPDLRLLNQVAAGLGLALRNILLTEDLKQRVDELRQSRRRIVELQDETRRRIERDLHDGAQQRLVALKIKVGLAAALAEKAGADQVEAVLDEIKAECDLTVESLRNLARGIFPPLLEAEGLVAALTATLQRASVPVAIQAAGVGRAPSQVESTLFFAILEAARNSIRHARARSVVVSIVSDGRSVEFEVKDDGIGFDPDASPPQGGLINIIDRLDAVEGTLELISAPGKGTAVRGTVPLGASR
jgi:signal transduction histidine kinase